MSYSWRERLRMRLEKLGISLDEHKWIETYIEQYCTEADRRCKEIDPNKAVDMIIDEMSDAEFDQFTKGVIDDVTKRLKAKKKKKKSESEEKTEELEKEIVAE
ncbi:MAG: hypothetical protein ACREAE_04260 [Nitrosopumilaceae archaeon]